MNIEGVCSEIGIGTRGLLTVEDVAGARACGEMMGGGDGVLEEANISNGREGLLEGQFPHKIGRKGEWQALFKDVR